MVSYNVPLMWSRELERESKIERERDREREREVNGLSKKGVGVRKRRKYGGERE